MLRFLILFIVIILIQSISQTDAAVPPIHGWKEAFPQIHSIVLDLKNHVPSTSAKTLVGEQSSIIPTSILTTNVSKKLQKAPNLIPMPGHYQDEVAWGRLQASRAARNVQLELFFEPGIPVNEHMKMAQDLELALNKKASRSSISMPQTYQSGDGIIWARLQRKNDDGIPFYQQVHSYGSGGVLDPTVKQMADELMRISPPANAVENTTLIHSTLPSPKVQSALPTPSPIVAIVESPKLRPIVPSTKTTPHYLEPTKGWKNRIISKNLSPHKRIKKPVKPSSFANNFYSSKRTVLERTSSPNVSLVSHPQ